MDKDLKMKDWHPTAKETSEERQIMVGGIFEELRDADPGDYSVYVGGDTLVFGTVDSYGRVHLYETRILRASEHCEKTIEEGHFLTSTTVGQA